MVKIMSGVAMRLSLNEGLVASIVIGGDVTSSMAGEVLCDHKK